MIPTAAEVLAQAAHWIGYREKKSNKDLLSFAANAGANNYTIFGKDVSIPRYWNGNKNGYDWCTSFCTACILYASGGKPDGGVANEKYFKDVKAVQPYTSLGASCKYETQAYTKAGRWSATPAVGYQAFFTRGHTGLVEKFDGKKLTLIEGNSNNKVERRTYNWPNAIFSGFGMPLYAKPAEQTKPKEPEKPKEDPKPSVVTFKAYEAKVTPSNGLNVRTGPSTTYKKLGALKFGTKIKVLEEKSGWGRIVYNGKAGWVSLNYTKKV
jgi:hypothetical protein